MVTCAKTKNAFVFTRLLSAPFWGIYHMLPFILYKDLGAGALPITTMIALKPMVALLSPYWSATLHQQRERLIPNLLWANILKYLPFLFFPWIDNAWAFVFAFALFMALTRGVIPAWMEMLHLKVAKEKRSHVFALGSVLDYLGMAVCPLVFGFLLDEYPGIWRWIFCVTALIGILSTLFFLRIPLPPQKETPPPERLTLLHPWRQTWQTLKDNAPFRHFQWGFMLGGGGLMLMQPVLPHFFVDALSLSYASMMTALVCCKALGFILSSPLWARLFNQRSIFIFSSFVTALAMLFPFLLLTAPSLPYALYIAFILYGVMQGGSEMSWNLSGPLFSRGEDSSLYSQTNVLLVGIRGACIPFLGGLLFQGTGSASFVMCLGALLCLLATLLLSRYRGEENPCINSRFEPMIADKNQAEEL